MPDLLLQGLQAGLHGRAILFLAAKLRLCCSQLHLYSPHTSGLCSTLVGHAGSKALPGED